MGSFHRYKRLNNQPFRGRIFFSRMKTFIFTIFGLLALANAYPYGYAKHYEQPAEKTNDFSQPRIAAGAYPAPYIVNGEHHAERLAKRDAPAAYEPPAYPEQRNSPKYPNYYAWPGYQAFPYGGIAPQAPVVVGPFAWPGTMRF